MKSNKAEYIRTHYEREFKRTKSGELLITNGVVNRIKSNKAEYIRTHYERVIGVHLFSASYFRQSARPTRCWTLSLDYTTIRLSDQFM